jgi:alpha-galactosidase/6-phospho-beta-glucosidase family protein
MQVTIIGGGSYQWTPKLMTDLLATPSLAGCHLVLMDIDPTPLPKMAGLVTRANEALGARATVETTTDRRRALEGADFVVVTISTGGFASMSVDLEVPARHGIYQSVGDSVGPGGISRSLRNIPVLVDIGRDMEQICPDAWLLNITNPMTCLTRGVARETSVKTVGLCHEIGNYCLDLAIAFGVPLESIRPTMTGVNHFPVITGLDIDGREGLEMLAGMLDELGGVDRIGPGTGGPDPEPFSTAGFARRHVLSLTLFDRFGALPAAGDRHLAEFLPSILTESSGWGKAWGIGLTPISRREEHQEGYIRDVDAIVEGTAELSTHPSGELVAPVIDSLITGTRREVPLNLPNVGQCPDLPAESVVEAICVVDDQGMRGRDAAIAPAPLAELLRRHVAVQELTVEAAVRADPGLVRAALALDPLAGRIDWAEIDAMGGELLAGTAQWLPQFARGGA